MKVQYKGEPREQRRMENEIENITILHCLSSCFPSHQYLQTLFQPLSETLAFPLTANIIDRDAVTCTAPTTKLYTVYRGSGAGLCEPTNAGNVGWWFR